MSNMSYCRFENTFKNLQDCQEALAMDGIEGLEEAANQYEKPYIRKLIVLCMKIVDDFGEKVEDE